MKLYVSTSALEKPFHLDEVLNKYKKIGIRCVELGSSHVYTEHINGIIERYKEDMEFLVHNYFPPHKEAFALNLASQNNNIREQSIEHAKNAIDLCKAIDSPIYSIHAGMLKNPSRIAFFEGFTFDNQEVVDYDTAFSNLIASCLEINNYARQRGVRFAIENSGGHPEKMKHLLMTRQSEFEILMNHIQDDNFGILLDVGHFKISEQLYENEDVYKFIEKFRDNIFQMHLHRNDGSDDQHLCPSEEELKLLSVVNEDCLVTLESMNNDMDQLLEAIMQVDRYMGRN